MSTMEMPRRINKTARVLMIILVAGLVAGVVGVVEHGWQHPADTIGAAVWLGIAMLFVWELRHSKADAGQCIMREPS
jgi:type IV secretory pathway TrbD component